MSKLAELSAQDLSMILGDAEWLQAEKARRSLREFVRQAWPVVEPGARYVPNWHIDCVCDHLMACRRREIKRLIINIPPRHSKSLIVGVMFPVYCWIDDPALRFLTSAWVQPLATRDAVKSRRILDSPWFRKRWGEEADPENWAPDKRIILTGDQNEKMRYENTHTGHRITASVGGGLGEGGNFLICDDPHNIEERDSDTVRQGILDWFDNTWSSRLNNPDQDVMIVIMQRVHELDVCGHLLERGGWEHLCLPTEYEPTTRVTSIGFRDPRTTEGELLNPERFTPRVVSEIKARSAQEFAAQHQQRPAPQEGDMIKRVWFRYWHPAGMNPPPVAVKNEDGKTVLVASRELPAKLTGHLQSWDMAFKDIKTSDYVAGGVFAELNADKFLLDTRRARLNFPKTVLAVQQMCAKWPQTGAKLVEDKANGTAVVAVLKDKIPGFIEIEPEGGKIARLNAVSWLIESGNFYVPHPMVAPWVDAYLTELCTFPNAAHDDWVDMTSQALRRMAGVQGGLQIYAV